MQPIECTFSIKCYLGPPATQTPKVVILDARGSGLSPSMSQSWVALDHTFFLVRMTSGFWEGNGTRAGCASLEHLI